MKYEEFKKRVIEAAEAEGLKDYELYYSSSEDTTVETFKHEVNNFSSSTDGGVCFRTLVNGQMGYASTEDLSAEEAAGIVKRAKANAAVLESAEEQFLGEAGGTYEKLERKAMEIPSTEEMVKTALAGQDAAYAADPKVIDGTSTEVIRSTQRIAIYNSLGLDLQQENSAVVFVTGPVVSDGKEMNNTYEIQPGALSELKLEEVVGKAVEDHAAETVVDHDRHDPTGACWRMQHLYRAFRRFTGSLLGVDALVKDFKSQLSARAFGACLILRTVAGYGDHKHTGVYTQIGRIQTLAVRDPYALLAVIVSHNALYHFRVLGEHRLCRAHLFDLAGCLDFRRQELDRINIHIFICFERCSTDPVITLQRARSTPCAGDQAFTARIIRIDINTAEAQIYAHTCAVQSSAVYALDFSGAHHEAVVQPVFIKDLGEITAGRQRAVDYVLRNFLIKHYIPPFS